MKAKKLPAKGVVWDLSDLYSGLTDPKIEKDKKQITSLTKTFIKKYKGKINPPSGKTKLTASLLLSALTDIEKIDTKLYIYLNYASYLFSQDTVDPKINAFVTESDEFSNNISTQLRWFMLEWQALDDSSAKKLIADTKLKNHQHFLAHSRVFSKYRKNEAEEIIMTKLSMTGAEAFVRFYDETSSTETYTLKVAGKKQTLNYSQISSIIKSHPSRTLRKQASEAYSEVLKQKAHFYTYTLNNLLLDKKITDEIRGYSYPEQATFLSYEVTPKMVEALVSSTKGRHNISHRFYKTKAKLQGYDKLYEWDRYSPIYPNISQKYSWEEAKRLVLESFSEFSPEFAQIAKMFFDKGWIDAEVRANKKGGAYCSYNVSGLHPYVLVNFNGEVDDVSTLAHELGHAIHAYLSRGNNLLQFYPSTATAEIASIFCESILFEKLFANTTDKKVKINLLANSIQGSFATIFRQTAFYEYEKLIHQHRREKGQLTTQDFNNYFQGILQPMFGKSLILTADHAYWWMPILHFYHYNFYVFTYAFGEALTNALYALYKQKGEAFVANYTKALKLGGSRNPQEIVKLMGKDITDPNFWNEGLDLLDARVKLFETLANQL